MKEHLYLRRFQLKYSSCRSKQLTWFMFLSVFVEWVWDTIEWFKKLKNTVRKP